MDMGVGLLEMSGRILTLDKKNTRSSEGCKHMVFLGRSGIDKVRPSEGGQVRGACWFLEPAADSGSRYNCTISC